MFIEFGVVGVGKLHRIITVRLDRGSKSLKIILDARKGIMGDDRGQLDFDFYEGFDGFHNGS